MRDEEKTKEQLVAELAELRGRLTETEKRENHLRAAEEELFNAHILNQTILDASPAGIVIFRVGGQGVLANNAAARITGGSREQLAAANYHSIASWKACGLYEAACKAVKTGEVVNTETDIVTTYGRNIRIDATFSTFVLGEEPYLALLFNDVTERRQMEEELRKSEAAHRSLIEQLPPGTWVYKAALDEIASTIYVSPQIEELGFTQQEWIAGRDLWSRQLHPDDRERVLTAFRLSRTHGDSFVCEYRMYARDNLVRWYRDRAVVIRDSIGTPLFYQGLMADITDSKQIEDFQTFLAQCGSSTPGEDFFHSLARYLGQNLETDFVCIDRLEEGSLTATTVAVYFDGKFEDNMTYTLKDTPCGDVVEKTICCFPSGVSQMFPNDKVLVDMKAESYAGTLLWGYRGRPIGLVALIWRKPMANPELVKSVLRMVGVRTAGELERKLAEDALRRSEELLKQSQEIAHLGSWELDLDRNILTWSDEAFRIFGFERGEVNPNYELFLSAVHPDDRVAVNDAYAGSLRENRDSYEIEHRVVRKKTGEVLVVHEKCRHIRDAAGRITHSVGMTLDITGRRAMEDQLRESRLMLQSVLDTIPVRVFWKDLNSVYLGCNRPFALDAGLSDPGELLGKDDYAVGWRDQADLYRADDLQVMKSGMPKLNFEEPQTTPDGKQRILKTSKIPLRDSNGVVRGVLGTYEDITESKRAEAELLKLSTAIEQSPASVVITDANGNIEYVNPKFTRLTGYSLEEAIGQNPRILKSDVLPHEEYERLWQIITAGDVWRGKFCNKKKNGDLYWESAVISPVKDANGVITHFLAVKEDITELKKAEGEKKGLEAQLRQAQKLETIGTLAGGIAHDFNNILQPINSCSELIRSRIPADSPLVKYVDLMLRSVERGSGLVKQLLAFSRQREHDRSPIRLQPVISETLGLLRAVMPASVEIHAQIDPACSSVMADPVQVQQVVMNLCTNACDAMDRNGVLTVRLTGVDVDELTASNNLRLRPGRYAQIVVRDTGHGIDEETQKRIFDPFFTTKEVGKGTGLGLSVVHGIVLEYGGEIVVESDPGSGTTFSVYLPCSGEAAVEESEQRGDTPHEGRGAILFVDDNEDIVFIANEMLENLGYSVTAMTSNAEALEKFRQNPDGYDLVISDYSMPGMNGIQFAWALLNVRPDIPVLLISGNDESIPAERLKEVAVRGVISKPFTISEISETIRRVLEE